MVNVRTQALVMDKRTIKTTGIFDTREQLEAAVMMHPGEHAQIALATGVSQGIVQRIKSPPRVTVTKPSLDINDYWIIRSTT